MTMMAIRWFQNFQPTSPEEKERGYGYANTERVKDLVLHSHNGGVGSRNAGVIIHLPETAASGQSTFQPSSLIEFRGEAWEQLNTNKDTDILLKYARSFPFAIYALLYQSEDH
jgi:hypothetical protein